MFQSKKFLLLRSRADQGSNNTRKFDQTIVSNGKNREFPALCRVLLSTFMVMRKEENRMDTKKEDF